MKKIYKENQLLEVNNMPIEVIESIKVTIDILNENYGFNRAIESDLGGYVVIAENIVIIPYDSYHESQITIPAIRGNRTSNTLFSSTCKVAVAQ